jgi:hypothetical protein
VSFRNTLVEGGVEREPRDLLGLLGLAAACPAAGPLVLLPGHRAAVLQDIFQILWRL